MPGKKAAQPSRTGGEEEFDDMPPLEYVGVNPTKRYSFLEGDTVRLKGLLKADLNGKCGTIMSFLNAAKDRIPVKLDSGGKMAIKPDNLEKLSGSRADAAGAEEPDDDDMPPLDYVGGAQPDAKASKQAVGEDEDDDEMPPLEHVGTSAAAAVPTPCTKGAVEGDDEDDDDDMPPLDYVGAAAPDAKASTKDAGDEDDDEDDMPPLEYVGAASSSDAKACAKDAGDDDDDDEMPPLENAGAASSGDKVCGKEEDDEEDDMPPLEYVGTGQANATPEDEDDDDMPPLEYIGAPAAAAAAAQKSAQAVADEDEDEDDMPPLEYVGTKSPGQADSQARQGSSLPSNPCQSGSTGDIVVLKGLQTAGLNGERARVIAEDPSGGGRIQVALLGSGRKLSVKPSNVTKVSRPNSEESDDSMPPLDENEPRGGARATSSSGPAVGNKESHTNDSGRGLGEGHDKSPEALIDLMKEAMQSSSVEQVARALSTVEAAQGVEWGDLLQKKKQLLRKLRLKRRKLEPDVDESPVPEEVESAQVASPGVVVTDAPSGEDAARALAKSSVSDKSSQSQSEKDWFFLGAEAKTVKTVSVDGAAAATSSAAVAAAQAGIVKEANPKAAVLQWCKLLQLPPELADRLVEEDVTDPSELTGVSNEELACLTKGLKIGPKGRFMKAVQRMRHLEQSELGSTC